MADIQLEYFPVIYNLSNRHHNNEDQQTQDRHSKDEAGKVGIKDYYRNWKITQLVPKKNILSPILKCSIGRKQSSQP